MMRKGTFIAVVGPSGVGKDTLLEAALARRSDLRMARRVIAPPRPDIGEDAEMISDAAFQRRIVEGYFALHWSAHGFDYAIPFAIQDDLDAGYSVLANLSRGVLAEAARQFDPFLVISVTAPKTILGARLARRGRENCEEIAARLERPVAPLPSGLSVSVVENAGTLEEGVTAFIEALPPPVETVQ